MFWASAIFFAWSFSLGTDWASKRDKKSGGWRDGGHVSCGSVVCIAGTRNGIEIRPRWPDGGRGIAAFFAKNVSVIRIIRVSYLDATLCFENSAYSVRRQHQAIEVAFDIIFWHHLVDLAMWWNNWIQLEASSESALIPTYTKHYEDLRSSRRSTLEGTGNGCDNRVSLEHADVLTMLPIRPIRESTRTPRVDDSINDNTVIQFVFSPAKAKRW